MPDINVNFTSGDLIRVNDTNVTLTLGGTPLGALLEDVTLTLGWTGTLADIRISSAAIWNAKQDAIPLGTPLQLLRTNAAGTAFESVTPTTTLVAEGTNLYYTDARVRATTLTGLSISGSTITSTDTVLSAFGKLQNQVTALVGGVNYQGTWNATTNSPALVSSTGTKGYYYVVSVAGSTNLDGITDWKLGDWVIFNGATWEKVDNTDAVISVNGYSGAVVLVKADIGLGNVENTALSTWAGTTNITTLGTIGTGTWQGSGITETYLAISDVTTNNVSNTAHGFFPKLTANSIYYVNNAGALTALTVGATGTVLTGNGVTSAPTWAASGSGITVGITTITSGTSTRIPYNLAGVYQEQVNFTIGSVATGVLDVPVGYAMAGTRWTSQDVAGSSMAVGTGTPAITGGNAFLTFFGIEAGLNNGSSNSNTAFGAKALRAACGSANTAVGGRAGTGLSGTANVTIGAETMFTSTGSRNTVIGSYAGFSHSSFSDCILLGYNTVATASNQAVIGSSLTDLGGSPWISNLYFNSVTHTAAQDIALNFCGGSGSNNAAANGYIKLGRPTGTSITGGNLYIQGTPVIQASGSTAQALATVMTITKRGDVIYGAGNFTATNNLILQGTTTDAGTAVELTSDGAAGSGILNRIAVPTNAGMSVVVNICVKQTGSANTKQMLRQFVISNNGGTTAIQGSVTTLGTDVGSAGLATVTCTITANNTDDAIKIEVNGILATTLRYTAYVVSTQTIYA